MDRLSLLTPAALDPEPGAAGLPAMNFWDVIGLFMEAGVDIQRIYWEGSSETGPDLLIQTDVGMRHVASVKVNEAGDIIVELGPVAP